MYMGFRTHRYGRRTTSRGGGSKGAGVPFAAEYLPPFPGPPHRELETISYVLRGEVEHGDSMGNHDVLRPGDVQRMPAGSGISHHEMPKGEPDGAMYAFQLWANLPAKDKMMEPRYRGVKSSEIPAVTDAGGATVKIIAGTASGTAGPVRDVVTSPEYLDVSVPAGKSFTHATPRGHTVFAYVIGGEGVFCRQKDPFSYEAEGENYFDMERQRLIGDGHLVAFDDGEAVTVSA